MVTDRIVSPNVESSSTLSLLISTRAIDFARVDSATYLGSARSTPRVYQCGLLRISAFASLSFILLHNTT